MARAADTGQRSLPWKVAGLYLACGLAWILGSDGAVGALGLAPETERGVQSVKGILFVALTAAVLLVALRGRVAAALRSRADAEESRARYRSFVDGCPDPVFIVSRGLLGSANPAALALLGASREEEVTGRPLCDFVHPDERDRVREHLEREARRPLPPMRITLRSALGKEAIVEATGVPLGPEGHGGLLLVAHDLTDRRRLEEQFRQAQKLESVGRLAATLAHDFNNLLTGILGQAQLALLETGGSPGVERAVQEIRRTADRGALLTRRLLAFARRQESRRRPIDLAAAVLDLERLLRRLLGEEIDLMVACDPEAGTILVDPGQLEQVVMNLVVNAKDAMPRGGTLTLATKSETVGAEDAIERGLPGPGSWAVLEVSDTGCGMEPETMARIFEPFFTTKEEGKGTGLGLSTVRSIVDEGGGRVSVRSVPGKGSTFRVHWPRRGAPEAEAGAARRAEGIVRGSGTILLVEDEDGLRAITRQVLEACGYRVLEARDGGEACLLALAEPVVDLLLADTVLPHTDTGEMVRRILARHPAAAVLFVSGYAGDPMERVGVRPPGATFLPKPFGAPDLSRRVRHALVARSGAESGRRTA